MLIAELLYAMGHLPDSMGFDAALRVALRFKVDNVARYLHEETGGHENVPFDIRRRIPNIAPLAPAMWFEYSGQAVEQAPSKRFGCLLTIDYDRDEDTHAPQWDKLAIPDGTRWILCAQYWIGDGEKISAGKWLYYFAAAEDGHLLDIPYVQWNGGNNQPSSEKQATVQEPGRVYKEMVIALLAICFCHCKGTVIQGERVSRQVRRAAERTGKPVLIFHTIDIKPAARILQKEGHIAENGLEKALHVCRGHFAHYTAEHPLFGKYTGTFYRPMHVRGSIEKGVVIKDYRVQN